MSAIEVTDRHTVYANPIPHVRSRHGYFPGLVKSPSGDLLGLFALGEAMDAANVTTVATRSHDQGMTWDLEGPIIDRSVDHRFDSDYLKPAVLSDGTVIATGYRFHRTDPDELLGNPQTDGLRGGDNLVCFSRDEGRTWSAPQIIPRTRPELVEMSGPATGLSDGTVLACGSVFPMWDGANPSGCVGVLLRSKDQGKTWDDNTLFYEGQLEDFAPSEPRLCEMQPGRIVALFWTHNHTAGKSQTNHVTVSHDGGASWSGPIDTDISAQASNLMYLGNDLLLAIHCHRERDVGLYVRIVDFRSNERKVIAEESIWGKAGGRPVGSYKDMAMHLKFGQASLLRLDDGDIMATHWAIEDCQGRILTHRLRVTV